MRKGVAGLNHVFGVVVGWLVVLYVSILCGSFLCVLFDCFHFIRLCYSKSASSSYRISIHFSFLTLKKDHRRHVDIALQCREAFSGSTWLE